MRNRVVPLAKFRAAFAARSLHIRICIGIESICLTRGKKRHVSSIPPLSLARHLHDIKVPLCSFSSHLALCLARTREPGISGASYQPQAGVPTPETPLRTARSSAGAPPYAASSAAACCPPPPHPRVSAPRLPQRRSPTPRPSPTGPPRAHPAAARREEEPDQATLLLRLRRYAPPRGRRAASHWAERVARAAHRRAEEPDQATVLLGRRRYALPRWRRAAGCWAGAAGQSGRQCGGWQGLGRRLGAPACLRRAKRDVRGCGGWQ